MWLEREDKGFVNLTNAFAIDVSTDYRNKPYVEVFSAGTDGEGESFVSSRTLYSGDVEACEAYIAWLKKQLRDPSIRSDIIMHTFEPPVKPNEAETDETVSADAWKPLEENTIPPFGSTVAWERDGKIETGQLVMIRHKHIAVISWHAIAGYPIGLPLADLLVPDDSTERDEVN